MCSLPYLIEEDLSHPPLYSIESFHIRPDDADADADAVLEETWSRIDEGFDVVAAAHLDPLSGCLPEQGFEKLISPYLFTRLSSKQVPGVCGSEDFADQE